MGCTRDSECEEGYYCDLDSGTCRELEETLGCWDNSECPEGQICKGGSGTKWVQGEWPFGSIQRKVKGICVGKGESVIRIVGVDDEKTCDYCRYMWTQVGREGGMKLPPYHEHCRCWGRYED